MDRSVQLLIKLIIWLGVLGFGIYSAGRFRHLSLWIVIPLCLPPVYYAAKYVKTMGLSVQFSRLGRGEKFLLFGLMAKFALYALGLFVPETSFDALWYHLPLAQIYASTGRIAPVPELLYSTMPRLGDMYFILGFLLHSPLFVKLTSFLFSLLFTFVTYHLSRQFLSRFYALLTALVINSLYVVAWQSTAGYVDLTRAVFELAALLSLIIYFSHYQTSPERSRRVIRLSDKRLFMYSALLTGFALSVKFQALIFLCALLVFLILSLKKIGFSFSKILFLATCFLFLSAAIAAPWYYDNFHLSGHPFYPLNLPEKQLDQLTHAGATSRSDWLISQTLRLPRLFYDLSANPAQQLTPLILILLPLLIVQFKKVWRLFAPLLSFIVIFLLLWYFLPPPESRYALSVIPPLIILEFYGVATLPAHYRSLKHWAITFALITIGLNYSLRLAASVKFLPLLTGRQTKEQYIDAQTTNFNRSIIQKYHSNYWWKYQYN